MVAVSEKSESVARRLDGQGWFLVVAVTGLIAVGVWLVFFRGGEGSGSTGQPLPDDVRVDADRAYRFLEEIVAIGPRVSGSAGMQRQQELLTQHFRNLGANVRRQEFDIRHPLDGSRVTLCNLIVEFHPQRTDRVLFCTHYDTRPFPDSDPDPRRRFDPFLGANDGGSGTALLCELGYHIGDLETPVGVDFVFFDAEEFIFSQDRDPYFLGSEHFARQYAGEPPPYRYRYGVLLDMVGDRDLQLYYERNSLRYARDLVHDIWGVADRLGVEEFIGRARHEIRDDHLPLNQIARIPTCDLIDFDYPRPGFRQSYWHTTEDTVDKCSGESLAKVGWVLLTWLETLQPRSE